MSTDMAAGAAEEYLLAVAAAVAATPWLLLPPALATRAIRCCRSYS